MTAQPEQRQPHMPAATAPGPRKERQGQRHHGEAEGVGQETPRGLAKGQELKP
jgi:hypothetical protein